MTAARLRLVADTRHARQKRERQRQRDLLFAGWSGPDVHEAQPQSAVAHDELNVHYCQNGHSTMSHLMSLLGVKRTWPIALHMSAFDPKRTWAGPFPVRV